MNIKKIIENVQNTVGDMQISPENLIQAIIKLLEVTHAHGLDDEAIKALSECGITLEVGKEG